MAPVAPVADPPAPTDGPPVHDDITLLAPSSSPTAPTGAPPAPSAPRERPTSTAPAAGAQPVGDEPRERRPRRRLRWVAAVLVAVLAGGGGAAAWYTTRDRTTVVPAVVGLAEAAALDALDAANLEGTVERRADETVAAGEVVAQDPVPGTELDRDAPVGITVSEGPAPRSVPDLTGLDVEAATAALTAVQLELGEVTERFDEQIAKGTVLEWEPTGTTARGTPVALVVSGGPEPRVVPNISGMTPDQAKTALPDGLTGEIVEVFSETVPEGQVVSANWKPGSRVERGTVIRIRVSKGPELVTVPDVSGRSVSRATTALKEAGFDVVGVDGPPDGTVQRTEPPAGRSTRKGTDVRLVTG